LNCSKFCKWGVRSPILPLRSPGLKEVNNHQITEEWRWKDFGEWQPDKTIIALRAIQNSKFKIHKDGHD